MLSIRFLLLIYITAHFHKSALQFINDDHLIICQFIKLKNGFTILYTIDWHRAYEYSNIQTTQKC